MDYDSDTEEGLNEWEENCGGWCDCGNRLECEECESEIKEARERLEAREERQKVLGDLDDGKLNEDTPHPDQLSLEGNTKHTDGDKNDG